MLLKKADKLAYFYQHILDEKPTISANPFTFWQKNITRIYLISIYFWRKRTKKIIRFLLSTHCCFFNLIKWTSVFKILCSRFDRWTDGPWQWIIARRNSLRSEVLLTHSSARTRVVTTSDARYGRNYKTRERWNRCASSHRWARRLVTLLSSGTEQTRIVSSSGRHRLVYAPRVRGSTWYVRRFGIHADRTRAHFHPGIPPHSWHSREKESSIIRIRLNPRLFSSPTIFVESVALFSD